MKSMFTGFLFIFLNFNITVNEHIIGLVPNFLGYYFILQGLKELEAESESFQRMQSIATGMIAYSILTYAMDLLGIASGLGLLGVGFGLLGTVLSLYISYSIVQGILEIEARRSIFLNGLLLRQKWNYLAVLLAISCFSVFIRPMVLIIAVAALVADVLFLVEFYKAKNLYEALPKEPNKGEKPVEFY